MPDDTDWKLVAAPLAQRIQERGLSLKRIERDTGVAYTSLKKLLDGRGLSRADRLATLATYLGWRGDAFDRIRRGESPLPAEAPAASGTRSDLRELLGVGGQIVEDRLARIEHHLGLDQDGADVVPLNADRPPKAAAQRRKTRKTTTTGAKRPTNQPAGWVYAADQDDGQPASDDLSKIPSTSHRPTRKSFDPDE